MSTTSGDQQINLVSPALTKREYFAAMALQGILAANANPSAVQKTSATAALEAVIAADSLILF